MNERERKLFGTDGVRGPANQWPMVPELALQLGQAVAVTFRSTAKHSRKRQRIIIGKDTRLSGYMIEQALASGICSMGADVYLCGPLPTPGIAFLTASMRADAGVVISGSHNSYEDNGIKFFSRDGFKLPDEIEQRIEALVVDSKLDNERVHGKNVGRAFRIDDAIGRYVVFLKNTFPNELTLDGIKIVVDCANGAGYRVAPAVFEELGAEVIVIGAEPNGENINLNCGSLHPEGLQKAVCEHQAHLGVALDGDADRAIFCDEKGAIVDGDRVMCMTALRLHAQGRLKNNTVVATIMSNMGLDLALRGRGIQVIRTAVGDRYVVEEMRKNGFCFGGEQSGHLIYLDHNTTGDGILAALQVLAAVKSEGRPFSELASVMDILPQKKISIKVKTMPDLMTVSGVAGAIRKANDTLKDQGRVVVRYSGTEAVARVMVEGKNARHVEELASEIAQAVRAAIGA